MLAALLSAAMLLPGGLPHQQGAHCLEMAAPVDAHSHAGGHDAVPNNSPDQRPAPCPHCPPARCATQSGCASLLLGVLIEPTSLTAPAPAAPPETSPVLFPAPPIQPPTPPPQDPFRLV